MPKRKAAEIADSASRSPLIEATTIPRSTRSRNSTAKAKDGSTQRGNVEEATITPSKRQKIKLEVEEVVAEIREFSPVVKRSRKIKEEVAVVQDIQAGAADSEQKETTSTAVSAGQALESSNKSKKKANAVNGRGEVKVEITETKVKRKRKTKEEKEAEAMPLAARTVGHKLYVGAHVSASGGVHKAVPNSTHIGGNAFALFLKSQRKWANPALTDEVATSFHSACKGHDYDAQSHVVPHGSYLVNLAHTDKDRTQQAYDSFLDDLKRCEKLGIKLYNFHPGNTTGNDRATAIKHLASNLNRAHKETKSVVTLLENMAAAGGNTIGTTFEDLRDIITHIDDKSRVGICLDTCHAFAAGYDLRTPQAYEKTFQQLDEIVGIHYLRALHLNDSKAPFGSRRDFHANIGTGFLGLRAFHNVANDSRLVGLPLVLETPISMTDGDGEPLKDEKGNEKSDPSIWAREIKLIESLMGMDVSSAEFLELEKSLARKGAKERKRLAEQAERRVAKEAKKAAKGKSKKSKTEESEESDASDLDD